MPFRKTLSESLSENGFTGGRKKCPSNSFISSFFHLLHSSLLLLFKSWKILFLILFLSSSLFLIRKGESFILNHFSTPMDNHSQTLSNSTEAFNSIYDSNLNTEKKFNEYHYLEEENEFWIVQLSLDLIGPPVFFLLHKILDPICFIASVDLLFLSLFGYFLTYFRSENLPENKKWKSKKLPESILEENEKNYPLVLIQLPMYNERQVFKRSIEYSCSLIWPKSRLCIQVLDDSTMDDVSEGMQKCVHEWKLLGINIKYKKRKERKGFKAGNLREGLEEEYAKKCEFVAIFDADFVPPPDWLLKTVFYFKDHPDLALVQTRWTFLNADECDLTRFQEVELTWHFMTEQLTGSYFLDFFGFNGTAGIWRLQAIFEAGNWNYDVIVEDMDMAFRTSILGWKFLFLPNVTCGSELPSTMNAYRKQQYRWSSGPIDLIKKRFFSILYAKNMRLNLKLYILFIFIALRKFIRSLSLFLSITLAFPMGILFPQSLLRYPMYGLILHIIVYNVVQFAFSPKFIFLLPAYAMFSNAMAVLRFKAIIAGLFDFAAVRDWVVTHKTGAADLAENFIKFAPYQLQRFGKFIQSFTPKLELKKSRSLPNSSPRYDNNNNNNYKYHTYSKYNVHFYSPRMQKESFSKFYSFNVRSFPFSKRRREDEVDEEMILSERGRERSFLFDPKVSKKEGEREREIVEREGAEGIEMERGKGKMVEMEMVKLEIEGEVGIEMKGEEGEDENDGVVRIEESEDRGREKRGVGEIRESERIEKNEKRKERKEKGKRLEWNKDRKIEETGETEVREESEEREEREESKNDDIDDDNDNDNNDDVDDFEEGHPLITEEKRIIAPPTPIFRFFVSFCTNFVIVFKNVCSKSSDEEEKCMCVHGWNGKIYYTELVCGIILFFSSLMSAFDKEEMNYGRILITTWTFFQSISLIQFGFGYLGLKE